MATDYKNIKSRINLRSIRDQRGDKTHFIQNPTDKVAVDERYDVRYQVSLLEIMEHGKLV